MYILPEPQEIKYYDKCFILQYNTQIIVESSLGFREINYAKILEERIKDCLCFSPEILKGEKVEPDSVLLRLSNKLKQEEYHLIILEEGIEIIGGNSNALLYGIQTLCQIIAQEGAVLNCLVIKDYPKLLNRGFYHDVTRGRIPTLDSLKALADKMSYYKLNQLQLYVEHSFLFRDFSEVWRDDTPLTAIEIMDLDEYCHSLNIELIPSIASFGHLYKVLSSKSYQELCEFEDSDREPFSFVGRMEHHTVDVTNEKSFTMIKNMLLEYMPLFSSKQFNLCADETFDLGKGKSKNLANQLGTDRVYVDFLIRLCDFVKLQGKRPMFWGDIILEKPEAMKELPEDVICLNWDYNPNLSEENVKKLYDLGITQYLCPGVHGWRRLINRLDYAYDNITTMCNYAHKYEVMGLLNTDWGDYGHMNHPEFSTSGMVYGAAFSWNSNQLSFEEINKRISALEYLDNSRRFVPLIAELEKQEEFLWESVVEYKECIQKRINKEEKEIFNKINLENLSISNNRLNALTKEMYQIMIKMDVSKRNVVKAYLIMAKGILLFNSMGATIGQYQYGINNTEAVLPRKLAIDLEYWFKDYKVLWRSYGKEAELYRLQEIIIWYADFLRSMDI